MGKKAHRRRQSRDALAHHVFFFEALRGCLQSSCIGGSRSWSMTWRCWFRESVGQRRVKTREILHSGGRPPKLPSRRIAVTSDGLPRSFDP